MLPRGEQGVIRIRNSIDQDETHHAEVDEHHHDSVVDHLDVIGVSLLCMVIVLVVTSLAKCTWTPPLDVAQHGF